MKALVLLGLLAVTSLSLVAALVYLYRWLIRARLFPQLPRLWRSERRRFWSFGFLFLISVGTFLAYSVVIVAPDQAREGNSSSLAAMGPSFDGKPPPKLQQMAPKKRQDSLLEGRGRVLPPQGSPEGQRAEKKAVESRGRQYWPVAPSGTSAEMEAPNAVFKKQAQQQVTPSLGPKAPVQAPPAGARGESKAGRPAVAKPSQQTVKAAKKKGPAYLPAAQKKPAAKKESQARAQKAAVKNKPRPYTVCASSHRGRKAAETQVARLKKLGFKARVVKVTLKSKGVWRRVCLGSFAKREEASAALRAFRQRGLKGSPFVTRLP